jgi:hypothetical protein
MDFSKTLFRCSSLGHLMTDPRNAGDKKAGNLSETAKTHLIDVFVSNKYGRNTDIQNKYIQKGLLVEEDSITLYSRVTKTFHKKNELPLSNAFIKGTPDLYVGASIKEASHIIDIKSSYDIFTFFRNHNNDLNNLYYWQVQGYMDLTGAKSASVAYCLVDTPDVIINDEKRRLMWKMGVATDENEDFKKACEELDRLLTYSDISMRERVIEFRVERNQDDIDRMHNRVEKAREYLCQLENRLNPELRLVSSDDYLK